MEKTFKEIAQGMIELQERKNADYGSSFQKSCDEFGLVSPAVRLTDKLNRFKTLIGKESQVKDESIQDTLIDLAAYAIMTVEWMRRDK